VGKTSFVFAVNLKGRKHFCFRKLCATFYVVWPVRLSLCQMRLKNGNVAIMSSVCNTCMCIFVVSEFFLKQLTFIYLEMYVCMLALFRDLFVLMFTGND